MLLRHSFALCVVSAVLVPSIAHASFSENFTGTAAPGRAGHPKSNGHNRGKTGTITTHAQHGRYTGWQKAVIHHARTQQRESSNAHPQDTA